MGWKEIKKELLAIAGTPPNLRDLGVLMSEAKKRRNIGKKSLDAGENEKAFIYLIRFCDLMNKYIKDHPSRKDPRHILQFGNLMKRFREALSTLELLVKVLEQEYNEVVLIDDVVEAPSQTMNPVSTKDGPLEPVQEPQSDNEQVAALRWPKLYRQENVNQPSSKKTHISRSEMSLFDSKQYISYPSNLTKAFLEIALPNTRKDTETCSILAGRPDSGRFIVTHLIVPPQEGTSNTVVTHGEEKLIDYQIEHDLITLGWIHTHPSQDCFLSSIDLHTHYGYQIMLPEAIAIVMAPSKGQQGCFSITPKGMEVLSKCSKRGFHQHSSSENLYGIDPLSTEDPSLPDAKVIRLDK